jgi:general secretion pathway protein A
MLLRYYGFREDPFGATPDSRCMYQSPSHCEALASLKYGFSSNRGFIALIAQPGMGKTTLLFRFLEEIRASARTAFIFDIDPQCEPREIVSYILRDIGIVPGRDHAEMHEQLNLAVVAEARAGRRFVVVIDEAQNLSDEALEVVRMLTNFETQRAKLMQVVLSGQPQLSDKLMKPSLLQLRQRISTFCRIEPLTTDQTRDYIDHRLKFVGYDGPPLFTPEAVSRITEASRGIPRNINNVCFNALSLCCALKRKQVDGSMIAEVLADQQLMPVAADSPVVPCELALTEIYRPEPRNGVAKLSWPFVLVAMTLLVATGLGVLGISELKTYRSHLGGSVHSRDATSVPQTARAPSPSPRSDPRDGGAVKPTVDQAPLAAAVKPSGPVEGSNKRLRHSSEPNSVHHVESGRGLDEAAERDNRARLADLRRQLSDLRATLPPNDYKIQRLQANIADLEQQSAARRANSIKRPSAQNSETPRRKQFVTQTDTLPQGTVNPAFGRPDVIQPEEKVRLLRSHATPVLLPAASRANAEAVQPDASTLGPRARLTAPSRPATNPFATSAPDTGVVASGSKE